MVDTAQGTQKVRVAIAGLGFGAEFIPIYKAHPDAELVAVCQRNADSLREVADSFDVSGRYSNFEELIAAPDVDAIHINTPIPDHAEQSIAALEAGKHVACTVPMATTIEDCRRVAAAARSSGKNYMMMETVVFSREFLHVQDLFQKGAIGRIQFLRGAHHQDMTDWPGYWEGLPPMHYATHAISPLLAIAGGLAEHVVCHGSGRISPEFTAKYGSPFAVESALVKVQDSDLSAEITRSLFDTAREYVESFSVYGDRASFEWQQTQSGDPVLFIGEEPEFLSIPDFADRLPHDVQRYTMKGVYDELHEHLSFKQGSGHGGSHPHLAHEFVRSIVEQRPALIDEVTAANWTSVGLCAHESAMAGGVRVDIPDFS